MMTPCPKCSEVTNLYLKNNDFQLYNFDIISNFIRLENAANIIVLLLCLHRPEYILCNSLDPYMRYFDMQLPF